MCAAHNLIKLWDVAARALMCCVCMVVNNGLLVSSLKIEEYTNSVRGATAASRTTLLYCSRKRLRWSDTQHTPSHTHVLHDTCAARAWCAPVRARVAQKKGFPLMPISSTSNSRVAPGGMSGPAPREPSAVQDHDKRSARVRVRVRARARARAGARVRLRLRLRLRLKLRLRLRVRVRLRVRARARVRIRVGRVHGGPILVRCARAHMRSRACMSESPSRPCSSSACPAPRAGGRERTRVRVMPMLAEESAGAAPAADVRSMRSPGPTP